MILVADANIQLQMLAVNNINGHIGVLSVKDIKFYLELCLCQVRNFALGRRFGRHKLSQLIFTCSIILIFTFEC